MCGRYNFSKDESKEIKDILDKLKEKYDRENYRYQDYEKYSEGEIFPTNHVPVLVNENGCVEPEVFKWGYPGFNNKGVIINARAETISEKKMFKDSLASKRCVIPSTGFYEWSHDGQKKKYRFNLPGTNVLYMAGIYRIYDGKPCFVIITAAANASMIEIHDRMPVVLDDITIKNWLLEPSIEILYREQPALMRK